MDLRITKSNNCTYKVLINDCSIGEIATYRNQFHSRHCYLKLDLANYDRAFSKCIFAEIQRRENRPLQIMLSSDAVEKIAFAESGGFVCARKCYGVEVTIDDLIYKSDAQITLNYCQSGSSEYRQCAHLMYEHYQKTHQKISPLTASAACFMAMLPERVLYRRQDANITSAAFVADDEIAYLFLEDGVHGLDFLHAVVSELFAKYSAITFECDDTDRSALKLMHLFRVEPTSSFNTYLKK